MARKSAPKTNRRALLRTSSVTPVLSAKRTAKATPETSVSLKTSPRVRVVRLPHGRDLPLPAYQTSGAAGMDLVAANPANQPMRLGLFERALVPTGLILELPRGTEGQVRPRSGLAMRDGITVLNAPGTIDSDYRGEVQVLLINLGGSPYTIQRGDRIAQLVIQSVVRGTLAEAATARKSVRGAGGFGSTGVAVKPPKKKTAKPSKAKAKKPKSPKRR
jgi:dUTP pyrophosphatase